jgi:hypothetical protein
LQKIGASLQSEKKEVILSFFMLYGRSFNDTLRGMNVYFPERSLYPGCGKKKHGTK